MKKIITVVLCAAMVLLLTVSVCGEGTVTFTEKCTTQEDGGIVLTLSVPVGSGITNLEVTFSASPEVLIKSFDLGDPAGSGNNSVKKGDNSYRYKYSSLAALDAGDLLVVTLYSRTTTSETLDATFTIVGATDLQGNPVNCTIEEVTVANPALGNDAIVEQGKKACETTEAADEEETSSPTTSAEVATTTAAFVIPEEELEKEEAAIYGTDTAEAQGSELDSTNAENDQEVTPANEEGEEGTTVTAIPAVDDDTFNLFLKIAVPVAGALVLAAIVLVVISVIKSKKGRKQS